MGERGIGFESHRKQRSTLRGKVSLSYEIKWKVFLSIICGCMSIFHLPILWNLDAWIKGMTRENCFLAKAGGITLTVNYGAQSSNPTECLKPLAT